MELSFSCIVPVYNRPDEVRELLHSLTSQSYQAPFEVVIVEDGSTEDAKGEVRAFKDQLDISYYEKPNSGPGDSRNYGMERAKGNYFIILDSDCVLPPQYLSEVAKSLTLDYVPCFGGPDAAHTSFSNVQKAIDYVMTSVLTTGGIRGRRKSVGKFQPRSFNMGLSKEVFERVGGFGNIHPGEDPDLTFRIWKSGYRTKLIPNAFVYHKRRIDWRKFYGQVQKFGMVRAILNRWHPGTSRVTYWFPSLFFIGCFGAIVLALMGIPWPIVLYGIYLCIVFLHAMSMHGIKVAGLSVMAVLVQFFGYGWGFLKSTLMLTFSKGRPETLFPHLFFKS
ncbi:MAG: glycosyltransferase family 2 protein [Flavobacteriaceae bacterium]